MLHRLPTTGVFFIMVTSEQQQHLSFRSGKVNEQLKYQFDYVLDSIYHFPGLYVPEADTILSIMGTRRPIIYPKITNQ